MKSAYLFSILLALLIFINMGIGSFRLDSQEGFTKNISTTRYNEYPLADNPLYLATLNSANIEFLHNKLKEYRNLKTELSKVAAGEKKNAKALKGLAMHAQTSIMGKKKTLGTKGKDKTNDKTEDKTINTTTHLNSGLLN